MLDLYGVLKNSREDPSSVFERQVKLSEEVGELAAALLADAGSAKASASAEPNVLEEGTDVVMCALDILFAKGFSMDDIQAMLDRKNIKWSAKINKLK